MYQTFPFCPPRLSVLQTAAFFIIFQYLLLTRKPTSRDQEHLAGPTFIGYHGSQSFIWSLMINRAISYIVFFIPPQVSNFTWAVAKHEQTFPVASSPLFSLFRDYTFFTVDISISVPVSFHQVAEGCWGTNLAQH